MKIAFYIFFICAIAACGSKKELDDRYEYIPLEKYNYVPSDIKDEARVRLLSYSGGPGCDNENIYYYQFIVLDSASNDTVRIFSPCQVFRDDIPENMAFRKSNSNNIMQNFLDKSMEQVTGNKYLIFNPDFADIEKQTFKTAFGSLGTITDNKSEVSIIDN